MQVIVSEVVKAVQPDMKVIVMMREPISRMYSAYWYYGCLYGRTGEPLTAEAFDSIARREVGVVRACLTLGASMRQCARENFSHAQQLVKGMYAAFAPDWLALYPDEQIMWIRAEDYYQDERHHIEVRPIIATLACAQACSAEHLGIAVQHVSPVLQRILDWIGVSRPDESTWARVMAKQANRGHTASSRIPGCTGDRPKMLPETRALLEEFYSPWNEMLVAQLGQSYSWDYTSSSSS